MKDDRVRRLAALLSVPILLLAACGDDGDDADAEASDNEADPFDLPEPERAEGPAPDDDILDEIEVVGEFGERPEVSFDAPIESDRTVRRVLSEGDGELTAYDEDFGYSLLAIDGETGEEIDGNFDGAIAPLTPMDEMNAPDFLAEALLDVPLGSRLVAVVSVPDQFGGIEDDDAPQPSVVLVVDLHGQSEIELENPPADDLPQLTLFNFGEPDVVVPDEDPPSDLTEVVLIEGDGDEVGSDDMLEVNYHGVVWDGGEVFDSSYARGMPASFGLDGVIDGWTEGLAGQTVGSTVLLVIPPEKGYGEDGSPPAIPGGATLVFVVEILDAFDAPEAQELPEMPDIEIEPEED